MLLPFPPGGATDIMARKIGQKMSERWGQQVVIDNRPGAGGNIAAEAVANATRPRLCEGRQTTGTGHDRIETVAGCTGNTDLQ
jgi:tripartite-type tricarboxylate transporter receptor subunit TctC